jgi:hypothetical protein
MTSALNTDLSTLYDITGIINLELDTNLKSFYEIKRIRTESMCFLCRKQWMLLVLFRSVSVRFVMVKEAIGEVNF